MNSCISESDLRVLGDQMIQDFERRVESLPAALCVPFHNEARQLETELLFVYRFVALTVQKEMDLEKIGNLWGLMVSVCDSCAEKISVLNEQHPYCGADTYHDRILDLRNRCERLRKMHS
jgi:hypothetical protein